MPGITLKNIPDSLYHRLVSANDCEFVWFARDLGLPLLTVDKKVLNAFSDVGGFTRNILSRLSL